jgi:predicted ribosome quality control (RQC) complex YloA/Tae2 family protein
MFKRARRLKQGGAVASERLRDAERTAARLASVSSRLEDADTPAAMEDLAREARAAAPRDVVFAERATGEAKPTRRSAAPSLPYRTFRGASGARILVGRGAAHNDALTFHVARPHDLWLHAKGHTGAHVIVPLDKGRTCPSDVLVDAAHLAAHFSDARGEGVVEIQHTPRRYLRKPKGSPPGLVVVDREKVTVLRVDADRITRLLATEELLHGS